MSESVYGDACECVGGSDVSGGKWGLQKILDVRLTEMNTSTSQVRIGEPRRADQQPRDLLRRRRRRGRCSLARPLQQKQVRLLLVGRAYGGTRGLRCWGRRR